MSIFFNIHTMSDERTQMCGELLTLDLKFGWDVMFLHAVSTSMFLSLFSVLGKVAPWQMTMGPSAPAGIANAGDRGSSS
jgi:hypothetical protein